MGRSTGPSRSRSAFTPLGHAILLALIQAGGLGIRTLTTFFAFTGGTLRQYASLQSLVGDQSLGRIRATLAHRARDARLRGGGRHREG